MARMHRFRVESLQGLRAGDAVLLPAGEARHVRVLRLGAGDEVELFDGQGRAAAARIGESPAGELRAELLALREAAATAARLILATAWPKGKRAALLVEKCTELGVGRIIPVRYARSVVHKAESSAAVARLRRIAAEAAKQCGRSDVPEIAAKQTFGELLGGEAPRAAVVLLDPGAALWLPDALHEKRAGLEERPLLLVVGPEGGFTPEESAAADAAGVTRARLAGNVLRVETAALAACAIAGALGPHQDS